MADGMVLIGAKKNPRQLKFQLVFYDINKIHGNKIIDVSQPLAFTSALNWTKNRLSISSYSAGFCRQRRHCLSAPDARPSVVQVSLPIKCFHEQPIYRTRTRTRA